MISRKMKLLSASVGAVAVIVSTAFAYTVHKEAAPASHANDQIYGASTVFGPDGKLIGAASNSSTRSYLQDGLPE
jgi:hypothetical protein